MFTNKSELKLTYFMCSYYFDTSDSLFEIIEKCEKSICGDLGCKIIKKTKLQMSEYIIKVYNITAVILTGKCIKVSSCKENSKEYCDMFIEKLCISLNKSIYHCTLEKKEIESCNFTGNFEISQKITDWNKIKIPQNSLTKEKFVGSNVSNIHIYKIPLEISLANSWLIPEDMRKCIFTLLLCEYRHRNREVFINKDVIKNILIPILLLKCACIVNARIQLFRNGRFVVTLKKSNDIRTAQMTANLIFESNKKIEHL